jgi:hypothetical protein
LIVRSDPTADASFAAILERSRLGMAIAAMIKMIATTINSSIREKPFCLFLFRIKVSFIKVSLKSLKVIDGRTGASASMGARRMPGLPGGDNA